MPKIKSNISKKSSESRRRTVTRTQESIEERDLRLCRNRNRMSQLRAVESIEIREMRLSQHAERITELRSLESSTERQIRQSQNSARMNRLRASETITNRQVRLNNQRCRAAHRRRLIHSDSLGLRSAFTYVPSNDYENDHDLLIGKMDKECIHCNAKKWPNETAGMCCSIGKVCLPELEPLPNFLHSLISGDHPHSKHFLNNVRKYNSIFQMTSFGANEIRENRFMPTYKIQGQVYHRIGSMLPSNNIKPQFLQIYFVSESDQISLRQNIVPGLKMEIIESLQRILLQSNTYIQNFKSAIENLNGNSDDLKILIHADRIPAQQHRGRFNAPQINEVAVVLVNEDCGPRDIILRTYSNEVKRISELHQAYDPLQYPLLFVFGENGYSIDVPQANQAQNSQKTVSCMHFYAYRLMLRERSVNHIFYFRQLFNQYAVDMMAKIISERLSFIKNNQKALRAESYIHLRDSIREDANPNEIGQMVILPSTFIGSPRYLHERTQDALTYVRQYGSPDLFITFTTNPNWVEIKRELFPNQRPLDRHDLIARVFHLKVQKLMHLITKNQIFGTPRCYMYSIEWQKRGLPHVHILIWLKEKIRPDDIDFLISAELPNKNVDPILFDCISKHMIHGPCGQKNPNSPCMLDGKCSKRFPKEFCLETQTGQDGYPKYRRRSPENGGYKICQNLRSGISEIDNRWVVPYCPTLSRCFNAHINVEYCSSVEAIRYICKYINKGSDQATFSVQHRDEIEHYLNGRYISTSEAMWRILSFDIHSRYPTVIHLAVHLENGQRVYFNSHSMQQIIESPPTTTLLQFFHLCTQDNFARTLLYCEVPSYYTWNSKVWHRRKRGEDVPGFPGVKKDSALGRVYTIHPNFSECFYLRLLLSEVRGPTSFNDLKTVNGIVKGTFQEACKERGLLESDSHWEDTIADAAISSSSTQLRTLLAVMLVFCQLSEPAILWEKFKKYLCGDLLRIEKLKSGNNNLEFSDNIYNEGLILLENEIFNFSEKRLADFGMPQPTRNTNISDLQYARELLYNSNDLSEYVMRNERNLSPEQQTAYDEIFESIENNLGHLYFLDAPGGTGKTYLLNLILGKVRSKGKIALAVSSSGIAATLLQGGRTAHSLFKLPLNINLNETPTCFISKNSSTGKLLKEAMVVIWDECTMSHRAHIEAVDRTLKDVRSSNKPMGGLTMVFSGDFRQTLPIIAKGTRADTIKACLISSPIWRQKISLKLTRNMRVHLRGDENASSFSENLLNIGNGTFINTNGDIELNEHIGTMVSTLEVLLGCVYPNLENILTQSNEWLCERAIITSKNILVEEINDMALGNFNSASKEYKSVDTVVDKEESIHYPTEFLNSMNPAGLPPHKLKLKIGAPIILLRNLKPPNLCNGTRLRVMDLKQNIITAQILTGPAKSETALIPRIPMIATDLPFNFRRLQFPVRNCFAMTINKAQGQSFNVVGVDLRASCFSHGQLYVALSRIGNSSNQFILTGVTPTTKNIVYPEVLNTTF